MGTELTREGGVDYFKPPEVCWNVQAVHVGRMEGPLKGGIMIYCPFCNKRHILDIVDVLNAYEMGFAQIVTTNGVKPRCIKLAVKDVGKERDSSPTASLSHAYG